MANPHLENGFTRIANGLLDGLIRIRIPGEARQIFDLIMRKTLGFNKNRDVISLSQFSQVTGLRKSHVIRAINVLIRMNLISKSGNGRSATYSINKDFDTWNPLPKKKKKYVEGKSNVEKPVDIPNKGNGITEKGKKTFPKKGHSKDNTKDNIQKTVLLKNVSELDHNSILYEIEHAAIIPTPPLDENIVNQFEKDRE